MRHARVLVFGTSVALVAQLGGCGGDDVVATEPATAYFELDGALDTPATFWDLPFPSDLRLTAAGAPDYTGFPNIRARPAIESLLASARERVGFPTMPVAWFRFSASLGGPLGPIDPTAIIAASATAPIQLLDIDPDSPELGTAYPVVAQALPDDDYTAAAMLAVAPQPGIVLRADTTYAIVVLGAVAATPGAMQPPAAITAMVNGEVPAGRHGAAAAALYTPLWTALDRRGVARGDVLTATVFTTGDEVAVLRQRSEAIRAAHDAVITNLHVDPVDGAAHDGFCELIGDVTLPQFQTGTQPFDTGGVFVLDGDGVPTQQGSMTVPLAITLPNGTMPAGGWPLFQFFHGSGGLSSGVVDLGRAPTADDITEVGKGPGFVVARQGIAAASSALPVNPERLPGAGDTDYLNFANLRAFPYTFQQGVIEQRLFLDALLQLQIPAATLAACGAVTLPGGATAHHFDASHVMAGGQSMGGMYTNITGAVEERYGALVPTGAGGFWNYMILDTATIPNARAMVAGLLGVDPEALTFMHPGLAIIATGWEVADPLASMARIARRPLPGLPSRNVYEPVGEGDSYFPLTVYDAAALAYGNEQAGTAVWPSMQTALASDGLDGLLSYPLKGNRTNADGSHTTNVVVQYAGDGIVDPHYIYRQLDAVKHQYGCFLATYLTDGMPTLSAPGALDAPCEHAP